MWLNLQGGKPILVIVRQLFVLLGGDGSLVQLHSNINKQVTEYKY
jgi:hypothetical protein